MVDRRYNHFLGLLGCSPRAPGLQGWLQGSAYDMRSFLQYITEGGLDSTAGAQYGDTAYRFNVRDLVRHTQSSAVKPLSLRHFQDLDSTISGESPTERETRTAGADTRYPIIVAQHRVPGTRRDVYQILDGTHRVRQALAAGARRLPARVVPPGHLKRFQVPPQKNA